MNKTFIIMKKELYSFYTDKNKIISTLILPGLMIFLMYSLMGMMINKNVNDDMDKKVNAIIYNMPEEFKDTLSTFNIVDGTNIDLDKEKIMDNSADLIVLFPENFVANTQNKNGISNVEVYFDSSDNKSKSAYEMITDLIESYESSIFDVVTINNNTETSYNLAQESDVFGKLLSTMLPLLILMFVSTGCIAFAPEFMAGEKERGTLSTLLITPMKRRSLAIGKVASLTILSSLSAISSLVGVIISLPILMGGAVGISSNMFEAYGLVEILILVVSTIAVIPFIAGLLLIISLASKDIKTAASISSPILIVLMGLSLLPALGNGSIDVFTALIPIYNVSVIIGDLFKLELNLIYTMISIAINLIYGTLFIGVLSKMLTNEKFTVSR
ncbi:MAG: ABC transporter permease [Anaerorhabdus sp.]